MIRLSRLERLASNLLLAAGSSLLVMLAAEAGLRMFRPVQYLKPPDPEKVRNAEESLYRPATAPGLSYEMVPDRNGVFEGMHVRTNHFGLRGPEPSPQAAHRFRVAALGDSFTFGFGVEEKETFPSVLQDLLNRSPSASGQWFEVMNFGVVGYSTRDEAIVLEKKALGFHPQGIIIGYVLNDPEIDPRLSLHKYFDPPVWWRRSHLLRLLHLGWNTVQVWIHGGGDYLRYLHAPGGEKWRSVEAGFRSIRRMADREGAWTLVAIFPLTPETSWENYPYSDLHAQVAREARANGFQVVDLLGPFRRIPPVKLRLSETDDHPSPLGHRIAAEAIYEAIVSGSWSGALTAGGGGPSDGMGRSPRRVDSHASHSLSFSAMAP